MCRQATRQRTCAIHTPALMAVAPKMKAGFFVNARAVLRKEVKALGMAELAGGGLWTGPVE